MPKETRRLHRVAEHVGAAASSSAAAAQQQDEEELVMAELLSRVSSLDAATYKANRLTDEEREFYEREGYLVVPGAIDSAADLAELQGLLGQMREENLAAGKANPTQRVNKAAFSVTNHRLFSASDAMVRLLTNPKVFPKVVDMLGINISLYHVQINTVPPGEESEEPDWSVAPTLGFHQDSGRSNVELEVPAGVARPRLTLKAGYMLTDLRPTGRGQTWLIPKSHTAHGREDIAGWPADGVGQPPGAFPFRAAPGDCVIFNRSTMHSASPNYSDVDRKVIFVGYGYRWVKPKDPLLMDALLDRLDCPVLRQLCGTTTNNDSFWSPSALDTPLRAWLHAIGVDTGLGVGFKDDNPNYRTGLTLEQLRTSTLFAPRLHAQSLPHGPDANTEAAAVVEELRKLQAFAANVQSSVEEGRAPGFDQVVSMLRSVGYHGASSAGGARED